MEENNGRRFAGISSKDADIAAEKKKETEREDPFTAVVREGLTDPKEQEEVFSILEECDEDFVPPLSSRESTFQSNLGGGQTKKSGGVTEYFEEIRKQTTLLIKEDGWTVAFISYRTPYTCEALNAYEEICYLTTMCVRKAYRGRGLSVRLYETIISYIRKEHPKAAVALRTWSTNRAQMYLMPKLQFACVATRKDDRGPGVDTMYFVLERDEWKK